MLKSIGFKAVCFSIIAFLSILIFGNSISVAFTSTDIVNQALKYKGITFKPKKAGDLTGQCKWFVQKVVREAGGSLGSGYHYCYLDVGKEISSQEATAGDIIQLDDPNKNHNEKIDRNVNGKEDNYTRPVHSAIVIENLGNGNYKVIDSNYVKSLTVGIHSFNPWQLAGNKLHVHFYRLGDISQGSQIDPKYLLTFNGVNGVQFDDSIEKVEQVFGKPQTGYCYTADTQFETLPPDTEIEISRYEGIDFHFLKNKLKFVIVTSEEYKTQSNIGVGSTRDQLLKAYPGIKIDEASGTYCIKQNNKAIKFIMDKNDKIKSILVGFVEFLLSC